MEQLNITEKEREIINLGASIAAGCQPCTKYHIKKCLGACISEIEIHEIIDQAIRISADASEIMRLQAITYTNGSNKEVIEISSRCETKRDVLVGLVVSYTINNTYLFDFYLKQANETGTSDPEILYIIETSKFIYDKAKAHVDILRENEGIIHQMNPDNGCSPGCGC